MTCAGVGAGVADGEAFSGLRAAVRAVALASLPAASLARVLAFETGEAEARWAVRFAEDADGTRFVLASTTAEMTTPAVTPSARSAKALPERLAPEAGTGAEAG